MGRAEDAAALAAKHLAAERSLIINVLTGIHLSWRPTPRASHKSTHHKHNHEHVPETPRECCPFVEIVLVETASGTPLEDFRFQTQRLRCKETREDVERRHSTLDSAHHGALRHSIVHSSDNQRDARLSHTLSLTNGGNNANANGGVILEGAAAGKPPGGATAPWHETFTYAPRPKDFWETKSLRLRVWDRGYLEDRPLGEATVNLCSLVFSIGAERRSFHTLVPFGDMLGVHGGDGQDNEESDESDDDDDRKEAHVPQLLFSLRYTKVIEPEKEVSALAAASAKLALGRSPNHSGGGHKLVPRPGVFLESRAPGLVGLYPATAFTKEGENPPPPRTENAMEPGLGVAIGARSHHIWRHASRLNLARRSEGLGPPQNGDTASSSSSPQQQHTLSPPANSKTAAGRGTNSSPHQQQQSDAATAKAEFELLLLALKSDDFGKELHLRHTPLGTLGQMQLATTLMQHNRTLLLLDLSNTQLTSDAVTGSALPQKQQLALPPGPGPGGRGGLRGLAGFVAKHPVLQTLKLSDNPLLGDDAASALASALDPSPPPLGHVTTTGVIVSPPATAAASSSVSSSSSMHQGQLPSPAQLATLELARCGIKKRGMTALATALYRNSCLTCLDLDANTAGPDGGAAFGNALRTNGALKSLQLTGNGLVRFDAAAQQHSFQAVNALAEALRFNQCLSSLSLGDNALCGRDKYGRGREDRSALVGLAASVKRNAHLRQLHLAENPGAEALAGTFKLNAPKVVLQLEAPPKKW